MAEANGALIRLERASLGFGAQQVLRDFAAEKGVKAGALINGARVALTGQGVAPSLFAVMLALGKNRTAERMKGVEELAARAAVRT